MAVKYLSGINLGQNELEGAVVKNYPTASLPSGIAGQIAYDSTVNQLKVYNGTSWTTVNEDTTYDLSVLAGGANTSVIRLAGSDATNDDVTLSGGSNVTITEVGNTITIASTNTTYTAGTGLNLTGTVFSLQHLGLESLADPNADRVLFWDDYAGATAWLSMGTNLAIAGTTLNATNTVTNAFTTIAVATQPNVVADSTSDTLTLVAGSNVSITTDAGTDTITINSSFTNNFVTAASFATGTGILTLNRSGLGDVTVDLDGRYLESYTETQTLDAVTTLGATTANAITVGGLTVNGNLTVSGAVQTKVSETLLVEDALFVLNSNETAAPTNDAGFVVERGTSSNVAFMWDESADEYAFIFTTETGTTAGNVVVDAYANIKAATANVDTAIITGAGNPGLDTDKFLVLDAGNTVGFRTGAQVLSDIGGAVAGAMYNFTLSNGAGTGADFLVTDGATVSVEGSGLIAVSQASGTLTISTTANNYVHPTQGAISQNNSGFTFIQDIEVNTLGHVTSVGTATVTAATTAATGVVELATNAEAAAGTDATRAVTPAGVNAYVTGREYVASIGDGTATNINVTHGLSSDDVMVQLYDTSTLDTVFADVVRQDPNTLSITFGQAPALNGIRVLVIKVG